MRGQMHRVSDVTTFTRRDIGIGLVGDDLVRLRPAAWRPALLGAALGLALPLAAQEKPEKPEKAPPPAAAPPAAAAPAPGDDKAAAAYRLAVARVKEQLGDRGERMPEIEDAGSDLQLTIALATSDEWRRVVATAAPALAQWQLALAEPKCRFRATSSEPLMPEYLQDLFSALQRCRVLAVARGLQAVADGDADVAVGTVDGLLRHASHLRQEPGTIAWAVAAITEKQAAALHEQIVRALPQAAAERSRAAIRRHLETRAGLAGAGAAARVEAFRLFDGALEQMQRGDDAKAKIARELADDVRRHYTKIVDPYFAVLEKAGDDWTPALRDELAALGKELLARQDERMKVLKPLMRDAKAAPAGIEPASDLGLLLATLLVTDLGRLAADQHDARERLRAVGR